jgi:hypothetical protein
MSSEREVSWGDEIEEAPVSQVVESSGKAGKPSKPELKVPEWSIDTRGDLPLEKALNCASTSSDSSTSANTTSDNTSTTPSWPEEESNEITTNTTTSSYTTPNTNTVERVNSINDNHTTVNYNQFDESSAPPPRRHRDDRYNGRSPPSNNNNNNNNSSQKSSTNGGRSGNKRKDDDWSSLNLPGVDLSKMPQATTRLSFKPISREEDQPVKPARDNQIERVARQVEDLSWNDQAEETPVIQKQVEVPVMQVKSSPDIVIEKNIPARLDCDGWGDELPEEQAAPIKKEPVTKSTNNNNNNNSKKKPEIVVPVPEIVKAVPLETLSTIEPISTTIIPTTTTDNIIPTTASHQHMYHPSGGAMMMPAYSPQYMMNHPMSPVGHMPMSMPPMSAMPGMMMPVWVTCPFCYHCYMYPPVVPHQNNNNNPSSSTTPSSPNNQ